MNKRSSYDGFNGLDADGEQSDFFASEMMSEASGNSRKKSSVFKKLKPKLKNTLKVRHKPGDVAIQKGVIDKKGQLKPSAVKVNKTPDGEIAVSDGESFAALSGKNKHLRHIETKHSTKGFYSKNGDWQQPDKDKSQMDEQIEAISAHNNFDGKSVNGKGAVKVVGLLVVIGVIITLHHFHKHLKTA